MTHNKYDFIGVCNQVLQLKNLDMVEKIHSYSFWIDLRTYLTEIEESEILKKNMPYDKRDININF